MFRSILTIILFCWWLQTPGQSKAPGTDRENPAPELVHDTAMVKLLLDSGRYYCSRRNDRALLFLQQAMTMTGESGMIRQTGQCYLWQGRVYYYMDQYDMAESCLQKAKPLLEKAGLPEDLALWHFAYGALNDLNGNYIQAVREYQEVIRLTTLSGDESLRSTSLISVGSIINRMKDPDNALAYFRDALCIGQRIGDLTGIASTLTNMGEAFESKQQYDSALHYYREGYRLRLQLHDDRLAASSEYSLGKLFNTMQRVAEAKQMLESAVARYTRLQEETGLCLTISQLALALSLEGKQPEAGIKGEQALSIARKLGNYELLGMCYETLAMVAATGRNYRQAYEYTLLNKKVSDQLGQQKKERVIREMEARFRVQAINNRMENLLYQSKVQQKNIILLCVSLGTLAVILVLIILLYRSKMIAHGRQRKLFEQERVITEQQNALIIKEQTRLRDQVEMQSRELAAKALEMLRMNETLGRIIGRLEQLTLGMPEGNATDREIAQIVHEIELHTQTNTWQEFDTIFRNIHGEFYDKLLKLCPDLTASEIKIAALLKLNLSTKEIAAITLKSEEGIKSTRYRLRKKLRFTSDEHLVPFLIQL